MPLIIDNNQIPENLVSDSRYRGMIKYSCNRGWQWARTKVRFRMGEIFRAVDDATDISSLDGIIYSPENETVMFACRQCIPDWFVMFEEAYKNRLNILTQVEQDLHCSP